MITVAFVSPWATTSRTHGRPTKCAVSAAGSVAVAMTSRSRKVSRRRRVLPASETSIAAGWARSASTTSRTTGRPLPRRPRRGSSGPWPLGERLQHLRLGRRPHAGERAQLLPLRRLLQPGERRDPELPPDACRRLGPEAGQPHEGGHLARNLRAALRERLHVAGLDDLDDLRLDRLADVGKLRRPAGQRQLGHGRSGVAHPRGGATVGGDPEGLLAEDLGEVREQVEPVCEIAVPGKGRDHVPIIGPSWTGKIARCARSSACRRTTSARTSSRWCEHSASRSTPPATASSCWTTTRRTGRASWPTSSRRSCRGSRSCTASGRKGSVRPTSRASGGRSQREPSSCSRSTATSPTIPEM